MRTPFDSGLLPLVVHDLRTPLNVIGLTLRMIEDGAPKGYPDLADDVRIIRENASQMERMLSQLVDYYRLNHDSLTLMPEPFDPRRLISETAEELSSRSPRANGPIRVEILADCPTEVQLDPLRARMAIRNILTNAVTAADGAPVRVTIRGDRDRDRWMIEVRVDRPPSSSVRSGSLESDAFHRMIGTADERRGMDLAIAARVTELFGGEARLEVAEGRHTTLVLDWPCRLPDA